MANIAQKKNFFKFKEMFEKHFTVIDSNKETYPVSCEFFETYLRDSKLIVAWHNERTGDSGEETIVDFLQNPTHTINKEVNNFMKNDYFPPVAPEVIYGLEANNEGIWDSVPMPLPEDEGQTAQQY